uniref:Uncharacterized protein AlNc14C1G103 n=1 Tax=Albugo laibachii Nc14 TaxID=890382 RepID=F0VYV2_9STRA|nr:conserved hypothetical protein [Albugo laibachii Nc14]|eukprot:CCA13967.1 conserved hypothetical protein [Albugo laibachii Nc14]
MRDALEAVADYLGRYGAIDEHNSILQMMKDLGWEVTDDSDIQYRALFAVMRQEVGEDKIDYEFLFERISQIAAKVPKEVGKCFYNSELMFHITVERLALALHDHDEELFKSEREVLRLGEGVYELCELILTHLYPANEASKLKQFLDSSQAIFERGNPKEEWLLFWNKHRLSDAAFRRDIIRALFVMEHATIGLPFIERSLRNEPDTKRYDLLRKGFVQQLASLTSLSRIIVSLYIPRKALEDYFTGNRGLWQEFSRISSITAETDQDDILNHAVSHSNLTKSGSDRIWSSSIPFASVDSKSVDSDTIERPASPTNLNEGSDTVGSSVKAEQPSMSPEQDTRNAHRSPRLGLLTRRERVRRKRWTAEEVEALLKGLRMFGNRVSDVWVSIKREFSDILKDRSNVDLKDKYRNLLKFRRIPSISS